ncbi:YcdB/YcdC domain-containing protein [Paenibacillus macerans]|uniref:S-layer homology domain-containing protein n=1 Tax=Paenibacillus macerans TaxID=44252 RepID=UPI003D320F8A
MAFIGLIALSVALPQGAVFAESGEGGGSASSSTDVVTVNASSGTPQAKPGDVSADPAKAKFTKEQAIAKVRELFPALQTAEVSQVELGVTNVYPAPKNQMVWTINWTVKSGNSQYGFDSRVDAMTGDLISTYLSFPVEGNQGYYPPKLTREQALEKAKAFIAKAAPSLSADEIKEAEYDVYGDIRALFGPVQYSFSFDILKNGLPSGFESLYLSVSGDGEITQFSRSEESLQYPSSVPVVTQADAEKKFREEFQAELGYVPLRKDGVIKDWVLAWSPSDSAASYIRADNGNKIDWEGKELGAAPITYSDVPTAAKVFVPRTSGTELTSDEAAKLVEQAAFVPEGRKLRFPNLDKDYQAPERSMWRLRWEEGPEDVFRAGFPTQTSAVVDALTGQIVEFQIESYNYGQPEKPIAAPSGAVKLTYETAKQRALEWVNLLYPQADKELKLVDRGAEWSRISDGEQYRYHFDRYANGLPIRDQGVSITLDQYGRLFYYYADHGAVPKDLPGSEAATVTAEQATKAYLENYRLQLQYAQIGGYMTDNVYVEPNVYLVYAAQQEDTSRSSQVLDAVTGKWVTTFEDIRTMGGGEAAAAKDLKGHWAEQDLAALLQYRVLQLDEAGNIHPDEVITVGDWLNMMASAANPYHTAYASASPAEAIAGIPTDSEYYSAVSFAVERKWFEAKEVAALQLNQQLTRERLAVLLTSMLQYDKLANFLGQGSAVNDFSDAKAITRSGEVAIAVRLGLLQGQSGKFNPQQKVTKAEAASVIMRLVKLQGKTDQPIGQE